MLEVHPNLFWRVSEPDFEEAVADLEARIPGLTDQQIIVELTRIASLIDGHSHLPLFQHRHFQPGLLPGLGRNRRPI